MQMLQHLLENNSNWARSVREQDPEFFVKLSEQQSPHYLWIGCSDSRVPANEIVGLRPGELFVHRNVANVVVHTDLNCLSAVQYATDVLKVGHIIVCGHYGCSGVRAVVQGERLGIVDNWLLHVREVMQKHERRLDGLSAAEERWDRLCELNVIEQVLNVCNTTIVKDCWARGQELAVHGWIYKVQDGLLRDMRLHVTRPDDLERLCASALDGRVDPSAAGPARR